VIFSYLLIIMNIFSIKYILCMYDIHYISHIQKWASEDVEIMNNEDNKLKYNTLDIYIS